MEPTRDRVKLEDCHKVFDKNGKNKKITTCHVWEDIKGLDAQIRTIEKDKDVRGETQYIVELGLFESLGETGGDILTEFFDTPPTREEILETIRDFIKETKEKLIGTDLLSRRDEMQLRAIRKIYL